MAGLRKGPELGALSELRNLLWVRHHLVSKPSELLYRLYVSSLAGLFGFYLALGLVDDTPVDIATVELISRDGPRWVGLVAALVVAAGLRSGANGGPLAIDEAELHFVLLSPIDRAAALHRPLRRLVLNASVLGAALGAVSGELASRRLPGSQLEWILSGGITGLSMMLAAVAAAMVSSSTRLRPVLASVVAVAVIAWSTADLAAQMSTSPFVGFGYIAVWPLEHRVYALITLVFPFVGLAYGLTRIGATSIERVHRRSRLVAQVRFALAQQDIRALVLLRRQLASEMPRRTPWFAIRGGGSIEDRFPVPVRDARSYARWPLTRIVRVLGLATIAGLALAGVWEGTTALIGVAGVALYVAAIDVVEPLGQELDHPGIIETLPLSEGPVMVWHLISGTVAMTLLWLVIAAVVTIVVREWTALVAVTIAAVPAAAAATVAAGLSIRRIGSDARAIMVPDELAGTRVLYRLLWPPALALAGALPILSARNAAVRGDPVVAATIGATSLVVLLATVGILWTRYRAELGSLVPDTDPGAS
jgi:hypothetical protein